MGTRKASARLISGVVGRGCRGTSCPSVQKTWQSLLGAHPYAEQSAAPDCLQRPLRSRFRQQVSLGVRRQNPADVVVNTIERVGRFATMEITGTPAEIYEQLLPATL